MQFYKFISTVLHPIVVPTLGVLIYFIFVTQDIQQDHQLWMLGLVFGITYVVPVLALIILKSLGLIESFQVTTIRERRMPVLLMTLLFYLLGNTLGRFTMLEDLGLLFYGTSFSLLCSYLLFAFELKSSLHLLSMGSALGFFLAIMNMYALSLLPIVMVIILLTGLVASSRLYLNAHTPKELVYGFTLGFIGQMLAFAIL